MRCRAMLPLALLAAAAAAFDVERYAWQELMRPDDNTLTACIDRNLPVCREDVTVAPLAADQWVLVGGRFDDLFGSVVANDVWMFNATTREFSTLKESACSLGGFQCRDDSGAALLRNAVTGEMEVIVAGGLVDGTLFPSFLDDVWALPLSDPDPEWRDLGSLGEDVFRHAVLTSLDQTHFYTVGGGVDTSTLSNRIVRSDLQGATEILFGEGTDCAPVLASEDRFCLAWAAATVAPAPEDADPDVLERIIVFGGYDSNTGIVYNSLRIFDVRSNATDPSWVPVLSDDPELGGIDRPQSRIGATLTRVDDNHGLLYGGLTLTDSGTWRALSDLWTLDFATLEWSQVKEDNCNNPLLPPCAAWHSSFVVEEMLVIAGGTTYETSRPNLWAARMAPEVDARFGSERIQAPTKGGGLVSITGANFGVDRTALLVEIGGEVCEDLDLITPSLATCRVPAGTGGNIFVSATVTVAGSVEWRSIPALIGGYEQPVVDAVEPLPVPTDGDTRLTITGSNFGPPSQAPDVAVAFLADGGNVTSARSFCDSIVHVSHTRIICSTPAGIGQGLGLQVTVDGLSNDNIAEPGFAYALPAITEIRPDAVLSQGEIEILGTSFGADRSKLDVLLGANGDERCVDLILAEPHRRLVCKLPVIEGTAKLKVVVVVGDARSDTEVDGDDVQRLRIIVDRPSSGAVTGAIVITVLAMILLATMAAVLAVYRNRPIVRQASPKLVVVIFLGAFLALSGIFALDAEGSSGCTWRYWAPSTGFSLAVGALVLKTWRISKLFNNTSMQKVQISDKQILLMLVGLLALDGFAFMLIGLEWGACIEDDRDGGALGLLGLLILVLSKMALMVYGCVMAFRVRNIQIRGFNESKPIGLAIYNISFVVAVIFPITLSVDSASSIYVLRALGIVWASTVSLSVLFMPKIYAILTGSDNAADGMQTFSQGSPPMSPMSSSSNL